MAKNDTSMIMEIFEDMKQSMMDLSAKMNEVNRSKTSEQDIAYLKGISRETKIEVDRLYPFVRNEVQECQRELMKIAKENSRKIDNYQKSIADELSKSLKVKDSFAINLKSIRLLVFILFVVTLLLGSIYTNVSLYIRDNQSEKIITELRMEIQKQGSKK